PEAYFRGKGDKAARTAPLPAAERSFPSEGRSWVEPRARRPSQRHDEACRCLRGPPDDPRFTTCDSRFGAGALGAHWRAACGRLSLTPSHHERNWRTQMAEAIESHVDLKSLPKEERLNRMRHSAAHVLAEAMVELFPDAELGIGPPIDT